MKHARETFKSIASKCETYDEIKEYIRSLHSANELSDKEYDYILSEWDNMLFEFNL